MLPVRSLERGQPADLSSMVIAEVDQIDRGLTVVATSVPLAEDLVVEILAEDLDGRIVLVLAENGPSEPLFERAARALLEYRRTAALLARLYPNGSFDARETPRVILAAGRFSERLQDLLALLRIPRLTLVECAVSDGGGGFHLMVTGLDRRVSDPQARADSSSTHRLSDSTAGVSHPNHGNGSHGVDSRAVVAPAAEVACDERGSEAGSNGHDDCDSRSLVDSMKQRLLRLSPDVVEEEDGDLLYFRVAGHLLATVCKEQDRVLVTPGGEQVAQIQVRDDAGVGEAMDAVFERFFGMSPTRRRIAAADRRAGRQTRSADRLEAEAAAGEG